jgi:hypothetical protein
MPKLKKRIGDFWYDVLHGKGKIEIENGKLFVNCAGESRQYKNLYLVDWGKEPKVVDIINRLFGLKNQNQNLNQRKYLVRFFSKRYYARYINHMNDQINTIHGFLAIMICCSVIESLYAFKNGFQNTKNKSADSFEWFFADKDSSKWLDYDTYKTKITKPLSKEVHKNIRNSIIHQAEITGGWGTWKFGPLVDQRNKRINITLLLSSIKNYLLYYEQLLLEKGINDPYWDNFLIKTTGIVDSCKL